MSYHQRKLPEERGTILWGYDVEINEFFLRHKDANGEDLFYIRSISTVKPHPDQPNKYIYDNDEMYKMYKQFPQIPENHRIKVKLDIPI